MFRNRSQLTIINNLKLETKTYVFEKSLNDIQVNIDLSVSFQTCQKINNNFVMKPNVKSVDDCE